MGHLSRDCFHRKDKSGQGISDNDRQNRKGYNNRGNLNKDTNFASKNKVDYCTFHAFIANQCPRLESNKWIIDSGCTSHMTCNKDYFTEFKPIHGKVYLAGRYNVLESRGIGTIKVKVQDNKDITKYVIMYDVIYVPNLQNNLLSVMKLMDRGLKVNFSNDTAKICRKNSSEVIAAGERLGDHLIIYMIPLRGVSINECKNTYVNNKLDISKEETDTFSKNIEDKWHRRLGHVNNKYMQRLIKENLVTGIKDRELKEANCESCKTCKLSRKTHKSIDYEQSNKILELLHIDVCGPMPVESIGGSRYTG